MNTTNETKMPRRVVIYACSGCSDAGELADRTARALAQQNLGEMSCLAGIGGRVKPLLNKAAQADLIVAVDGCPLNCARHTLEHAGFQNVHQLELHRLGLRKGDCPPDDKNVARAVQAGAELIRSLERSQRCCSGWNARQPLTRPSATLPPSDGERDGVRGRRGIVRYIFHVNALKQSPNINKAEAATHSPHKVEVP